MIMVLCAFVAIAASAQNELVFVNKTVESYVKITQTKCKNSEGVNVAASYYMYCRENNDCTHMNLTGASTGNLSVDSGNEGKTHNMLVEWGDSATLSYKYTIY